MTGLLDFLTAIVWWFGLSFVACGALLVFLCVWRLVERRRAAPRPRSVDEIALLDRMWMLDSVEPRRPLR